MKNLEISFKKVLFLILIIVLAIVMYVVFRTWVFMGNISEAPDVLHDEKPLENDPINLLFLGIDENPGRSDTIILVSYNPSTEKLLALSIPRDTLVEIPGYYRNTNTLYGKQKINHAHAYGSIPLSVRTVESFLGINIHYYARVDYSALHGFVDIIGGVPLNVSHNMNYTDDAGGLYISLKKGEQVLDGKKAEQFLRWRQNSDGTGDGLGDIGRVQRQQLFIKATIKQLMKPANLLKINKIEELVLDKVTTNVPPSYMIQWFKDYAIGFDFEKNFSMVKAPGDFSEKNGVYWMIEGEDFDELNKIVQDHLMPDIKNDVQIKIYNSTKNKDIAGKIVDKLNNHSFIHATFAGNYHEILPLTEVRNFTEDNIAKYIASMINAQNNVYLGHNDEETDLVIIIGEDLIT